MWEKYQSDVAGPNLVDWLLAGKKKSILAVDRTVLVVLTFKNTLKSKFYAQKQGMMALIQTECGVEIVRDINLFVNKNELI